MVLNEDTGDMSPKPRLRPGQFYGEVIRKHRCSGLILSELKYRTGLRLPEHYHQLACFCLLLRGDYSEYLGRKPVLYKPLSVVFHTAEMTHRDEVGISGGHFFVIEMESRWIEYLPEDAAAPVPTAPVPTAPVPAGDLTWLALRLYREFRELDACSPLAIEGLILAMLAQVARLRLKAKRQMPDWLTRAIELIHEQFRQNLTISSVAAEVGIHPFHFSKVFQQFQKQAVGEFINQLRVQFACRELTDSGKGLANIALDAGFADQSHFTRVFKQVTGVTPGAFRNFI
jgi:AraC family transcriptional regulator